MYTITHISWIGTGKITLRSFGAALPGSRGSFVFWEVERGKMAWEDYLQHIIPKDTDWPRPRRDNERLFLLKDDNAPIFEAFPVRKYVDVN